MAPKLIDNERKVCDAVARALEERAGAKRSGAFSPEDTKTGAPIEYVFDLGDYKFAIEHTVVEAFPDQIQTNKHFGDFVAPIEHALAGALPKPGKFDLHFRINPSEGMSHRATAKTQAAIVQWVRENAMNLHAERPSQPDRPHSPHGYKSQRKAIVEGVEVLLVRETGWWMPEKAKGRLFVGRFAPPQYETLRLSRMKMAIEKKLPKLMWWKDRGARSVLILENRDMALSNHGVIYDAAEVALTGRDDIPNEIWLVDTTIEKEWTVWCLQRDGQGFPDEDTDVRFRDFDPNELTNV